MRRRTVTTWDNSIEPACTVEPGSGVRFDCRDAYVLCSVTIDLNISEIVDAPNWT